MAAAPDPGFGYAYTCTASMPVPAPAPRSIAQPLTVKLVPTVDPFTGASRTSEGFGDPFTANVAVFESAMPALFDTRTQ